MAIELPDSLWGRLGTAAGQGLESGYKRHLDELAQQRLMRLKTGQKETEIERARAALQKMGADPDLAYVNPTLAKGFLTEQWKEGKTGREAQTIENALNPSYNPMQFADQNLIKVLLGNQAPQQKDQEAAELEKLHDQQLPQEPVKVSPLKQEVPTLKGKYQEAPFLKYQQQIESISQKLNDPTLSALQKQQLRSYMENLEDKGLLRQEKADKVSEHFFSEVNDFNRSARDNNWRLARMEKLTQEGNMSEPLAAAFVDLVNAGGYGLDISRLLTDETNEFTKLSSDFLKNVKSIFGARVTEGEVARYLKTVPSSHMTAETISRVIQNLRLLNEANEVRYNTMEEIINENGGHRPADLERQVETRAKKQLDAIGDKFRQGIDIKDIVRSKKSTSGLPPWLHEIAFGPMGKNG